MLRPCCAASCACFYIQVLQLIDQPSLPHAGHLADILGDVHIEMLVHGNLDRAEAEQLAEAVASDVHGSARPAQARLPADQRRQERGCQVPDGPLHLYR